MRTLIWARNHGKYCRITSHVILISSLRVVPTLSHLISPAKRKLGAKDRKSLAWTHLVWAAAEGIWKLVILTLKSCSQPLHTGSPWTSASGGPFPARRPKGTEWWEQTEVSRKNTQAPRGHRQPRALPMTTGLRAFRLDAWRCVLTANTHREGYHRFSSCITPTGT